MSKELKKHQDYNVFLIVGVVVLSTITVLNLIIQW